MEDAHSEQIFLTASLIYYVIVGILEYDEKVAAYTEFGETTVV